MPICVDEEQKPQQASDTTGKPPTVLALTRHLGLANTTFRRHFPNITTELTQQRSPAPADSDRVAASSRFEKIQRENTELRRARRELAEHLELSIANIQRLTLDNHHLRQQLQRRDQDHPHQRPFPGLTAAAGMPTYSRRMPDQLPAKCPFDIDAYVRRSRTGPCFVCAILEGHYGPL